MNCVVLDLEILTFIAIRQGYKVDLISAKESMGVSKVSHMMYKGNAFFPLVLYHIMYCFIWSKGQASWMTRTCSGK